MAENTDLIAKMKRRFWKNGDPLRGAWFEQVAARPVSSPAIGRTGVAGG